MPLGLFPSTWSANHTKPEMQFSCSQPALAREIGLRPFWPIYFKGDQRMASKEDRCLQIHAEPSGWVTYDFFPFLGPKSSIWPTFKPQNFQSALSIPGTLTLGNNPLSLQHKPGKGGRGLRTCHICCLVTSSFSPSPPPNSTPWQGELVRASIKESKQSSFSLCIFLLYGLDCKVIRKYGLVLQAPDRRPDLCPGSQDWPGPDITPPGLFPPLQTILAKAASLLTAKYSPSPLLQQPDLGPAHLQGEGTTVGKGVEEQNRVKKGFIVQCGRWGRGWRPQGLSLASWLSSFFHWPWGGGSLLWAPLNLGQFSLGNNLMCR